MIVQKSVVMQRILLEELVALKNKQKEIEQNVRDTNDFKKTLIDSSDYRFTWITNEIRRLDAYYERTCTQIKMVESQLGFKLEL